MVEEKAAAADEAQDRAPEENKAKRFKQDDAQLSEKIAKQIEYYFSDVNVVKDKFMQEQFKLNDGWVKLSTLLTFARLKEMTTSEETIVEALKDYESDIIDFNPEKKLVHRKHALPDPETYKKDADARTVHISGFPTDYNYEQLRRFCGQFGDVEACMMRKLNKTRVFKGCIHVVFKNEADAKKVLNTEVLKIKDRELRSESMDQYHKRKAEMREKFQARKKEASAKKQGGAIKKENGGEDKAAAQVSSGDTVKAE